MSAESWWVIKAMLGGVAGVFAVLVAVLTFLEKLQSGKHRATRAWFCSKWQGIDAGQWLRMPEQAIRSFLTLRDLLARAAMWVSEPGMRRHRHETLMFLLVATGVALARVSPRQADLFGSLASKVCCITIAAGIVLYLLAARFWRGAVEFGWFNYGFLFVSLALLAAALHIILAASLCWAVLATVLALPGLVFLFFWPLQLVAWERRGWAPTKSDVFALLAFGFATSLAVTLFAMLVGHIAYPKAWIPQTLQMLVSNVVLDGFTLVVTFIILARAVSRPGLLRIPIAVLSDVLVAALLACGSLYFGLIFTEKSLSFREVLNVLIAQSPDGSAFEIGPYFWTTHTTFLPTLAYLFLIMVAWLGKVQLIAVRWFLGKGAESKNPLALTAALCVLIMVVFGALAGAASYAEDYAKRESEAAEAATSRAEEAPSRPSTTTSNEQTAPARRR